MIFSTDNGGNVAQGGNNYPLRGGKYTFWEGGNRGIGFLHSIKAELIPVSLRGTTHKGLFNVADWYATICEVARLPLPIIAIDSISQWTALRSEHGSPPRKQIIHETVLENGNISVGKIRSGKWNLYVGNPGEKFNGWYHPNGTIEPGPENCAGGVCLFDMDSDVIERHDVAAGHPDVVATLLAKMTVEAECPDGICETDIYAGPIDACEAFDVYGAYGPWASITSLPLTPLLT